MFFRLLNSNEEPVRKQLHLYKIQDTTNTELKSGISYQMIISTSCLFEYKYKVSQTKLPGPVVTFESGIFVYDA